MQIEITIKLCFYGKQYVIVRYLNVKVHILSLYYIVMLLYNIGVLQGSVLRSCSMQYILELKYNIIFASNTNIFSIQTRNHEKKLTTS